MKISLPSEVTHKSSAEKSTLQIVLIHDHPAMAAASRAMLERHLHNWVPSVDAHWDEWSFQDLEHPKFHSEALEMSKACDIFLIAVTGYEEIPVRTVDWIDEWLRLRSAGDTAIIVCVGHAGVTPILDLTDRVGPGLTVFNTHLPAQTCSVLKMESPSKLLFRKPLRICPPIPETSPLNE